MKHINVFFLSYSIEVFLNRLKLGFSIKKKRKYQRLSKLSNHQTAPYLTVFSASPFTVLFPPKNMCSLNMVMLSFLKVFPEISHTCELFRSDPLIKFIPHPYIGFMSPDCTVQDISWRMCRSSLIFMYFWKTLLICFGSQSCMNITPWQHTSRVSDEILVCCSMLW